ncbi:MAG: hypothetical protein E6Q97_18275 [Desulfurellales bacterium]|nr:MAG: hypothetical protein E6Q97_18275 [Desulfurellales bacterium]
MPSSTQMTNFPAGFAQGVNVRGMPLLSAYPGKVYWVSSVIGSDGNRGTFDRPFATIDYAVGRCAANKGDIIMVMPGHVETVSAAGGLALDVAGIAIVGMGTGSLRPTVNFTTVVGADMNVDAANITIMNMLFTGGIDALTGPIDVNAADFTFIGCETRDVTGQATDFIVTDANASRFLISNWKHLGAAAAGADTAISIVGGDDWAIENFNIYGNFAVGAIENVTTAANRARIGGGTEPSYIWTENAADIAITMAAASTGWIGPNINIMLQDNAANITECTVGAAMQFMQPINIVNLAGESSMQQNITASTDA